MSPDRTARISYLNDSKIRALTPSIEASSLSLSLLFLFFSRFAWIMPCSLKGQPLSATLGLMDVLLCIRYPAQKTCGW